MAPTVRQLELEIDLNGFGVSVWKRTSAMEGDLDAFVIKFAPSYDVTPVVLAYSDKRSIAMALAGTLAADRLGHGS